MQTKAIVGGTKKFHFDVIDRLKPDLIIGNKEENYEEGIAQLRQKYPVWMSDIITIEDAVSMILSLSQITGKADLGLTLVNEINESFRKLKPIQAKRSLYLIWKEPFMGVGKETFIHSMMEKIGLINCLNERDRYPELSMEYLQRLSPELILLSTEPYPFRESHVKEFQNAFPSSKILLVDGEMFSWYGSRMLKATDYFNRFLELK